MAFAEEGRRERIPISLIKQLQISLREEAGVPSSYDPQNPSLSFDHLHSSSSSSLSDILGKFDPSVPSYLRCKQCRAPLLRGLKSIVCTFCGVQVKKDIPPDPIPFKSTHSYKWLLESLDLNGSEAVGLEDSGSSKGKAAQKDHLILSDVLDLELKWPTDQEKLETVTNKASFQSNSSLSLAGVDLDNYFTGSTKESATGQGSPNLCENTQAYNLAVGGSPNEGAGGETFSGWDAGFQSASSGTFPGDSKYHDSVVPNPDLKFKNRTVDSDETMKADLFPPATIGELMGNSNDPSSRSSSWMEDDLWPSKNNKTPNIENVNSKDDPFDPWQDFASSGNAKILSMAQKQTSDKPASSDKQASDVSKESLGTNVQQVDFFSGVSKIDNVSTNENMCENSTSNRLEIVGVQTSEDGNGSSANSANSNVVESLMSQMHDLSFMLDTNLSIPKTGQR
ncbi:hypothetical protein MKX01_002941 [Papaver californicum]|nr:hypothetical protein MKX01_002941 [Papaver californicum]